MSVRGAFWGAVLAWMLIATAAQAAVEIRVRLARHAITLGESVNLEVIVSGAMGGVSEPDLGLPGGVEVLASSRGQNFTWVNGSSMNAITYRYEISASDAGHYRIGPVRVRIGSTTYEANATDLEVTAAPRQVSGRATGGVSLVSEITPRSPYIGEMVMLRVRLIQGANLAEDPQYAPPATTGFWSERTSEPESYWAQQGGRRVLVTETRTRLYPLASGPATISEATASVVLAQSDSPFPLVSGARRALTVRSDTIAVAVRSLPAGAPAGFNGAVGHFTVNWSADRVDTPRDVPFTVRLDVRGVGNLPLLKMPRLDTSEYEIFASTLDDSLPAPGSSGNGRRRFQWTLLPRRLGSAPIASPAFIWFDPDAGAYRVFDRRTLTIRATPPIGGRGPSPEEAFPSTFLRHPADPTARSAEPWALALAGALLGAALVLTRRAQPDTHARAAAAQQREWLRAVGLARGPEFWDAADRASLWLREQGRPVGSVPQEISAARYGKVAGGEERIRRRIVELLSGHLEGEASRTQSRIVAAVLAVTAIALGVLFGPHPGGDAERQRARRADEAARGERFDSARTEWLALWRLDRSPALAARLGWAEIRRGRVGEAAAWVVRGDAGEPRDPALEYVAERVREAGGLTGERFRGIPLRSLEWGLLAALAAAGALLCWPRRVLVALLLVVAVGLSLGRPLERLLDGRTERGALLRVATLEGANVELEPGQVVRIVRREPSRVFARVGGLEGWLPAIAVAGAGTLR